MNIIAQNPPSNLTNNYYEHLLQSHHITDSQGVGIGHNNNLLKESYIYLDSDKAIKQNNDTYEFLLNSSINCTGIQQAYVYLKQFSCVNNMSQMDESSFWIIRDDDTNLKYQRTFKSGSFDTIDALIIALNNKFFPNKGESTIVDEKHSPDHNQLCPMIEFTYENSTNLVKAYSTTGISFSVYGKVFDLLKFDNKFKITHLSSEPIDINSFCTDAYISLDQLENSEQTVSNIPNILYKVPLTCDFGQYLHHEIMLPIQPKMFSSKNISKLCFKIFNNIGETWHECIRFNMTLAVQIRQPVIKLHKDYWTEANISNFLKQEQLSKNPPLPPTSKCPEIFI